MMPSSALLFASFIAGTVGFVAGWLLVAQAFRSYRAYFHERVESSLKGNFITASVARLFVFSLMSIAALTIGGYLLAGLSGAIIGLVSGIALPGLSVKWLKRRRAEQFIYQLPDALHALSSTLRSGVSLPKGLEQLATWQPAPLSQEFRLVLSEYQLGRELGEALERLQERIPRPELVLMSGAINISRSVGGNLADTLESLALMLSEKLAVEGKIGALTAMGKLQGWVVSCIPLLMGVALYFIEPDRVRPLYTEVHGWITLGIIAVLMSLAVFMIRKIVNIDV